MSFPAELVAGARRFGTVEYEIEDEPRLFDASTNPSLERGARRAKPATRLGAAEDRGKAQRGEYIPEEEPEHQMA
jgi:hypothetical protein